MKGFLGLKYYCEICDKGYDHINKHYCDVKCPVCYTECKKGNGVECSDCYRLCRSQECFQRHKAVSGKQMTSICQKQYQCQYCHRVILRKERSAQDHVCHEVKCVSCQQFVLMSEHRCFLKQITAKEPSEKYIFFDFEADQSSGEHIVNFAVCIDFQGVEHVFSGYDACDQFCAFLFSPMFKGYTAIAHNMKGYDGQFILAYLLKQGVTPHIIPNGSKIMALEVKTLKIRIVDSFNFLPMALSKLPKTFGLTEIAKGYFPHFFNTRDNQNYIGPLPEISYYGADFMHSEDRQKFLEWHEVRSQESFHFKEEMYKYCKSDVDILRRSCIVFRQEMMGVTGMDPFLYTTIASLAMGVYRSLHIPRDAIMVHP